MAIKDLFRLASRSSSDLFLTGIREEPYLKLESSISDNYHQFWILEPCHLPQLSNCFTLLNCALGKVLKMEDDLQISLSVYQPFSNDLSTFWHFSEDNLNEIQLIKPFSNPNFCISIDISLNEKREIKLHPVSDSSSQSWTPLPSLYFGVQYPAPLSLHEQIITNKQIFMHFLSIFHIQIGVRPYVFHMINDDFDLFFLYNVVTSNGGFKKVLREKKWNEIISNSNLNFFSNSNLNSNLNSNMFSNTDERAYAIRKLYVGLLHHFEQVYFVRQSDSYIPPPDPLPEPISNALWTKVKCPPSLDNAFLKSNSEGEEEEEEEEEKIYVATKVGAESDFIRNPMGRKVKGFCLPLFDNTFVAKAEINGKVYQGFIYDPSSSPHDCSPLSSFLFPSPPPAPSPAPIPSNFSPFSPFNTHPAPVTGNVLPSSLPSQPFLPSSSPYPSSSLPLSPSTLTKQKGFKQENNNLYALGQEWVEIFDYGKKGGRGRGERGGRGRGGRGRGERGRGDRYVEKENEFVNRNEEEVIGNDNHHHRNQININEDVYNTASMDAIDRDDANYGKAKDANDLRQKERKGNEKEIEIEREKIKMYDDMNLQSMNNDAFFFFCIKWKDNLKEDYHGYNEHQILQILDAKWNQLTEEEKMPYLEMAEKDKIQYQKDHFSKQSNEFSAFILQGQGQKRQKQHHDIDINNDYALDESRK